MIARQECSIKAMSFGYLLTFLSILLISPCTDSSKTYESVLSALLGSQFTIFVSLLDQAKILGALDVELQNGHDLTILAPTDYYIESKAAPGLMTFLTLPENIDLLRKVLLHHILPGRIVADTLTKYENVRIATYSGDSSNAFFSKDNGSHKIDSFSVVEIAAIDAMDGVVHSIDGLLVPSDILEASDAFLQGRHPLPTLETTRRMLIESSVTEAPAPAPSPQDVTENLTAIILDALTAAENYTTFQSLLLTYDLVDLIVTRVESGSKFTVFAPDNNAFTTSQTFLNSLNTSQVLELLLNHFVESTEQAFDYSSLQALAETTISAPDYGEDTPRLTTLASGNTTNDTLVVVEVGSVVYISGFAILDEDILSVESVSIQGVEGILVQRSLQPSSPPPLSLNPPTNPPSPISNLPPPQASSSAGSHHLWATFFIIWMTVYFFQ